MTEHVSDQHIRELYEHNKTFWRPQRDLDLRLRDQVFGETAIALPNTNDESRTVRLDPERMHMGEAARIVSLAISPYFQPAVPSAQYTGSGTRGEKQSDNIALGFREMMERLNTPADAPRAAGVEQIVIYGRKAEMILSGAVGQKAAWWHDMPIRRTGEGIAEAETRFQEWERHAPLPIAWINLPVDSTFSPSFGSMDEEVLSTREMSWTELARIFSREEIGDAWPEKHEDRYRKVILATYSNREVIVYILFEDKEGWGFGGLRVGREKKNKRLREVEHKLGRCAIRIVNGMTNASRPEPGYFWKSVLFVVRDMLDEIEELAGTARTASKMATFPNWVAKLRNPDGLSAQALSERMRFGDIWFLDPGDPGARVPAETIEPLHVPNFGEREIQFLSLLLGRAELTSGTSHILQGEGTSPGEPAWSTNFKADLASKQLAPLTTAIGAGDLDSYEGMLRSTVAFGEPITLVRFEEGRPTNITLDPDIAKDYKFALAVEFTPQLPHDDRLDWEQGMNLMAQTKAMDSPIPSMKTIAARFFGIKELFREFEEGMTWQFITDPATQKVFFDAARREAELDISDDEGMTVQDLLAAPDIPDQIKQVIVEWAAQQQGGAGGPPSANGGGGAPAGATGANAQLQASLRAAGTFGAKAGGPKPGG